MKLHALLAAFILPVAVMFIVTGSLYTWGIKGSYTDEVYEIPLDKAMGADQAELADLARSELDKLGLGHPEGKPKIKTLGSDFQLEWTGSSKDLTLEPTDNALVAKLTIKNTSWYRTLVQLHKAKGGTAFKVYAVVFATSIALLLLSGFMMAWQTPRLKRATLMTSLVGLGSFLAIVWLS
jgi:hypothetical protein